MLERQINERLGVDRVGVSMGENVEQLIVVVGKSFGRSFYVETEYHHNAPQNENRTEGRVDYSITPSWILETTYGDANKGSIDIYWQRRFKRHRGTETQQKGKAPGP